MAPGDAEPVRGLIWGALGITPYVDRVMELSSAAERGDPESHALVTERDGTVAALALFGPVAGAAGVWHLSMVLLAPSVDPRDVGRVMVEAVVHAVRRAGGRLIMAELPADAVLGRTLSLLRANEFRQEGKIADYYREGVALLFLRREL